MYSRFLGTAIRPIPRWIGLVPAAYLLFLGVGKLFDGKPLTATIDILLGIGTVVVLMAPGGKPKGGRLAAAWLLTGSAWLLILVGFLRSWRMT